MIDILIVSQIILAVLLTGAILMQKSSSIGLGAYSGSNDSVFGAKGPMNFLTKFTFTMGLVFILNTLSLVYLYNKDKSVSVTDKIKVEKVIPKTPKTEIPSAPVSK